jgi:hypothetical protein
MQLMTVQQSGWRCQPLSLGMTNRHLASLRSAQSAPTLSLRSGIVISPVVRALILNHQEAAVIIIRSRSPGRSYMLMLEAKKINPAGANICGMLVRIGERDRIFRFRFEGYRRMGRWRPGRLRKSARTRKNRSTPLPDPAHVLSRLNQTSIPGSGVQHPLVASDGLPSL